MNIRKILGGNAPAVITADSAGSYRHEIKLLLTKADYAIAHSRLSCIMKKDENSVGGGDYFIRSLYYDDLRNRSYWDKLSGVEHRKKYRIRTYNFSESVIKLEIKEKRGDRIKKTSVDISKSCAEKLISGDCSEIMDMDSPVAADYAYMITARGLRPAAVVDYLREAYVDPIGNVRITFDKSLRAGFSRDMFDEKLLTVPIFPNAMVVMEVKYDELIPKHLSQLVSGIHGQKMAVSKYALCRERLFGFKPSMNLTDGGII